MNFRLSHKDLLELKFWIEEKARDGYEAERGKLPLYLEHFCMPKSIPGWGQRPDVDILEIGTGPYWGLLAYLRAEGRGFGRTPWTPHRTVAVDPLFPALAACSILDERGDVFRVDEPFEHWDTDWTFDAIIATNSLDHGEMGFYLMPKIARLLKPDGCFFLHVHLRSKKDLNIIHDHALTREQFARSVAHSGLSVESFTVLPKDVDGEFCEALVAVLRRPA